MGDLYIKLFWWFCKWQQVAGTRARELCCSLFSPGTSHPFVMVCHYLSPKPCQAAPRMRVPASNKCSLIPQHPGEGQHSSLALQTVPVAAVALQAEPGRLNVSCFVTHSNSCARDSKETCDSLAKGKWFLSADSKGLAVAEEGWQQPDHCLLPISPLLSLSSCSLSLCHTIPLLC